MDVSFTNVLVGARQYFQGLPVPSTAGTTLSTENLATSTSSSYGHVDVTGSGAGPTSSTTIAPASREATTNQQRVDSRTTEDPNGPNQVANSYWNPPGPVELYAPQPTRVEVPDTRPSDGSCTSLEAPNGSLTEMQPANKHSSSTAQLHQLQPPKTCNSPPPVYQQLNTVSRTPYSTSADIQSSYQSPVERPAVQPSSAMVAPRTQYYPRYHHPDITKSTPLPMTQSSTYQSANVVPVSGVVQQPATRSSPAEQGYSLPPGAPAQGSRAHESQDIHRNHGSGSYVPSSVSNGGHQMHPVQSYSLRNALPSSNQQQQQQQQQSSAPSPVNQTVNHQVAGTHGNAHTHIPSPHNLPAHIPSPQNSSRVNPSPLQHHPAVIGTGNPNGTGYCPRVSPHMPTLNSAYHSSSPHEASPRPAPSPHASNNSSTFQPHSPTYPPPPQPPQSSTHSYPSSSSQHYQTGSYPPVGYQQPQSSGYHSLPKNPNPGYYGQNNRSQGYAAPQVSAPTTVNSGSYIGNGKSIAYNGVQDPNRRNNSSNGSQSYSVQSYQTPTAGQRTSNTHNLPPIADLYHHHRNSREALSKAQPMHRQPRPQSSTNKNSSAGLTPTVNPTRTSEYSVTASNHSVNGNVVTSASSMYSRGGGQSGAYPRYATTMAPSHHGSNATSTTVTSNGAPIQTRSNPPTPVSSAIVHPGYPANPGRNVNPYPSGPHAPADSYGYKDYMTSSSVYPTSTVVSQSVPQASSNPSSLQTNGTPNRKRESPLDLSLRTIKTPADSTAQDDPEASGGDKIVSSSNNSSRNSAQRSMMSPDAAYQAYVGRNFGHSRSPAAGVRPSTPGQTVRAPKVDFLPNFSSTPLHHKPQTREQSYENNTPPLRRSTSQHLYTPSPRANPPPLPNMSTFKKNPPPPSPGYDKNSPYHHGNAMRSRYPTAVVDPNGNAIAHQEYPVTDSNKYYVDRGKAHHQPVYPRERQPSAKRPAPDTPYTGPSKQPRLDTWRLTIDQQIEQRLSTAFHERQQRQELNMPNPVPNGIGTQGATAGYEQSGHRDNSYNYCDKRSYPDPKGTRSSFTSLSPVAYGHQGNNRMAAHPHPSPQSSGHTTSYPNYRQGQGQAMSYRVPGAGQSAETPSNTGADKRVLSLLRNSLENKQHREEQLNNSQQPILANHNQQSFQNKVVAPVEPKNIGRHNLSPFTAASLLERNSTTPPHYKFHVPRAVDSIIQEPSRSLYGSRVNSSATIPSKEANSMSRGIENQILRDKDDGLAAILAARIRTKAELKQVGAGQFGAKSTAQSSQEISATPRDIANGASTSTPQSGSSGGSPPKLTREQAACLPPRRRLFSKTDEDLPVPATIPAPAPAPAKASMVPPRASEFRSSSETSVFDFRESDSEGEMPVLERQTLEEMRRDRRQLSKVQPPVPLNNAIYIGMASSSDLVKIELKENDKINEPDSFWSSTCDKFMEQLRSGDVTTKKRGRRKKGEGGAGSATKLEPDSAMNTDTESVSQVEMKPEDIKQEVPDLPEDVKIKEEVVDVKTEENCIENLEIKTELIESEMDTEKVEKVIERDSDELPLIQRATRKKSAKVESDCEEEIIGRKKRIRRGSRIKLESSSGSESSSEESDASTEFGHGSSVADRLRARKRSNTQPETEGMKLRSRDTTPHKATKEKEGKSSPSKGSVSQKAKPKPLFGDGSDFRPGWEEEVYVYKKSLRMPTRLITVSKPSRFHRLSTSLPDLDPGSPALSVSMDSTDICLGRKRMSDSDLESNCSFSVAGLESKIDDEEATSSTTMSCPTKTTRQTRSESNSIVDLLAQRVGTSKKEQKRKAKDKLDRGPKVLPKGSNEPELLATPSLTPLLTNEAPATPQKTKGKTPVKSNKSQKPIKFMDSFLLGYFRKETVNNFRDAFKNNLPNEFSTFVLKSRTRTETRVLKKQATIREVFGEDRPASAPPMQNHGDTSQDDDDSQNETQESTPGKSRTLKQKVVSRLKSAGILRSNKAIIKSKLHLLNPKKRSNLLKSLAKKKLQHIKKEKKAPEEEGQLDESNEIHETENNEPELTENVDEAEAPNKKRLKLRTGRRKFRSGFDYIRKKKKPLKKDDALSKERKRQSLPRPSPESVADIQTEIRTWVIKKGVGETILHRAARLGYTDVAAYCLEKLDSAPSPKDNAGYTPLHEACSKGHLEIAKLLLAYGANVSESANGGIRPLHEAAENGATELVRLLLSYGADPLLATYSGQTPLMLATDTDAYLILEQHLDDVQGRPAAPWSFGGPSKIFDLEDSGYSPLNDPPMDIPEPELDDIEMEVSDVNLPVLYSLANDPDKWVLLQDLTAALRVKSRDALLRQVNPKAPSGPPAVAHRDVMRELKLPDFLEQSRCCHLLSGGERINVRASKVTLIKYNDKVKSLLNVERVVISSR